MLGDRALVGALRAGEADAGRAQRVAGVLVGAGADRLDEGEPRAPRRSVVAPQARDQQHVRLADARLQLVEAAHLERSMPVCAARSARPCDRPRGRSRWRVRRGRQGFASSASAVRSVDRRHGDDGTGDLALPWLAFRITADDRTRLPCPGPCPRGGLHACPRARTRWRYRERPMSLAGKRICVVGAGAIGGYLAVRLATTGADVSVVVPAATSMRSAPTA